MGQITIYLDDQSEKKLKSAATSEGIPVSRWIAQLVRDKTRTEWPESVRSLAGAWSDFPLRESLRNDASDTPREKL